jgi:DSF synthase
MSAQPSYADYVGGNVLPAPRFARRLTAERRGRDNEVQWVRIDPNPENGLPNFTPELVAEFQNLLDAMVRPVAAAGAIARPEVPGYTVVQSNHPEYFSVGGDLAFFRACIERRDADTLRAYSMRCLDLMHGWSSKLKGQMTSIALVQGRALGGGFEMVLSCDYVVAEERSSFGFPEIMFGLFPCTGAMGLLSSRIGARQAERMMTNKRIYTALELLDMGVIDEVVPDGQGEAAVERYIAGHKRRQRAMLKVQESRERHSHFDYAEGVQVVEDWVELAMDLSAEELRTMEMLVLLQKSDPALSAAGR